MPKDTRMLFNSAMQVAGRSQVKFNMNRQADRRWLKLTL